MVETIVLDYLNKTLDVPAFMERPDKKHERYILVEKTGGSVENYIESATLAIQSYAESLYQAAVLNEMVKGAMRNIIALPEISKVSLNSDYNYTNTAKKEYRYQAVYDLIAL